MEHLVTDHVSPSKRTAIMKSVGTKNTKPEMVLRRALHALGLRYRLHRKDLPGSPDIVFSSRKKVIFVNGCYWHGHGCTKGRLPKSNLEYWAAKIAANRERDLRAIRDIDSMGWRSLTVWQCQIEKGEQTVSRVAQWLDADSASIYDMSCED